MYKVLIESLDGNPITERTGRSRCKALGQKLPKEGAYLIFHYVFEDGEKRCESPGVCIATDAVEHIGNEYNFRDDSGRQFKLIVLEEVKEKGDGYGSESL